MKPPSKDWREVIAPDEAQRIQKYVADFVDAQQRMSKVFGNGRGLHRRQLLALKANLEVLADIPAHAKFGLFAKPAKYDAWIRLSNGGMRIRPDSAPDIRGYALKVKGLNGPGALGNTTNCQDFLMINQDAFSSPQMYEFMELVIALSKGNGALLKYLFGTFGFFGAIKRMRKASATFGKPFSGFATERFNTSTPIACGPYAVRVGLAPAPGQTPAPGAKENWAGDIIHRLKKGPLVHDLQLQFFVDEAITPIEDASVPWVESESPFVTVAKLTIPQQDFSEGAGQKFADEVAQASFDPWGALMDHRPLGNVMRGRKVMYLASQKTRGATG